MGGLVSSVFGGGGSSTSVQQQAANTTTINTTNEISNIIDLQVIADAIKATAGQTQELIASLSKAQIITQIADVQAKIKQNEILQQSFKTALLCGAGWLTWRYYNGK